MSKITPEARDRCAAHSLAEQLEQLRVIHRVEALALRVRQKHDMGDMELMLNADKSWSGQHARLTLPIEGAD